MQRYQAPCPVASVSSNVALNAYVYIFSFCFTLTFTGHEIDANNATSSGYGFACFAHLFAFILSSAVSLYMSPLVSTKREAQMLKTPADVEGSTNPSFSEPQKGANLYDGYPKTN